MRSVGLRTDSAITIVEVRFLTNPRAVTQHLADCLQLPPGTLARGALALVPPLGQLHLRNLIVNRLHAEIEELLGTASLVVWVELEMLQQVKHLGHRIAFFDVLAALGRVFRDEGDAIFGSCVPPPDILVYGSAGKDVA